MLRNICEICSYSGAVLNLTALHTTDEISESIYRFKEMFYYWLPYFILVYDIVEKQISSDNSSLISSRFEQRVTSRTILGKKLSRQKRSGRPIIKCCHWYI
jgi:hypothetical protein